MGWFSPECCHWWWILGSSLRSRKQKAIYGISSYRFYECREIQKCSLSEKSHAHHFRGSTGSDLNGISDYKMIINSHKYCDTRRSLMQQARRIRPESKKCLLHHNNVRPHCSAQMKETGTSLKFAVVPYPLYSQDLAPSNFWLFPKLKEMLKGKHFSQDAEVDAWVVFSCVSDTSLKPSSTEWNNGYFLHPCYAAKCRIVGSR